MSAGRSIGPSRARRRPRRLAILRRRWRGGTGNVRVRASCQPPARHATFQGNPRCALARARLSSCPAPCAARVRRH